VKSLSPDVLGSAPDEGELTPEQAKKLSDKLSELLEDGADGVSEQNRSGKVRASL
jgi:hypothetical protein